MKCVKHAYKRHYLRRTQNTFGRSFLQERLGFISLFEIKSIFWHQNPKISRVILHRKGRSHHILAPEQGLERSNKVDDHFGWTDEQHKTVATIKIYKGKQFCLICLCCLLVYLLVVRTLKIALPNLRNKD